LSLFLRDVHFLSSSLLGINWESSSSASITTLIAGWISKKKISLVLKASNPLQGIPGKGALLTQLSAHWFSLIASQLPNLKTHLISTSLPNFIPSDMQATLSKRSMQVRRFPILPLESIVRGYITGSAWSEYKLKGTVHGMTMPPDLQESQRLEKAVWTPSTKAEAGEHDENISKERAAEIVGRDVAARVEEVSLQLYEMVSLLFSCIGLPSTWRREPLG